MPTFWAENWHIIAVFAAILIVMSVFWSKIALFVKRDPKRTLKLFFIALAVFTGYILTAAIIIN